MNPTLLTSTRHRDRPASTLARILAYTDPQSLLARQGTHRRMGYWGHSSAPLTTPARYFVCGAVFTGHAYVEWRPDELRRLYCFGLAALSPSPGWKGRVGGLDPAVLNRRSVRQMSFIDLIRWNARSMLACSCRAWAASAMVPIPAATNAGAGFHQRAGSASGGDAVPGRVVPVHEVAGIRDHHGDRQDEADDNEKPRVRSWMIRRSELEVWQHHCRIVAMVMTSDTAVLTQAAHAGFVIQGAVLIFRRLLCSLRSLRVSSYFRHRRRQWARSFTTRTRAVA